MEERSLELKKAGLAIPKVLEKNRLLLPYHLYQAKRDWKQIAGEQIAKYSYILDFKDKQVIIAVMNPVYMNYLFMYKNKKFFILGMARSGYEVAKLLAKDNTVFITDMKEQDGDKVKELESLGVTFILSDNPTDLLDDSYDIMVKNPGIKYDHPTVVKAKNMGIPVINEVEVAYHYLDHDVNIIGVTGSNGKTTTVSIIYEIMKKAFGDKVFLAGNIGTPLCHFVSDIKSGDYLVMEISDHQLCDMYEFKTNVSVMTNIYDCHADFHDGHDKYVQTKKKIFMNHGKDDVNIINKDNKEEMAITRDIIGVNYYFNGKDAYFKDGYIYYNNKKIII